MAAYKCYFSRGVNVPTLQTIECDQDGEAITRATTLLESMPAHLGIMEIWKETRLLARVSRARSSSDR